MKPRFSLKQLLVLVTVVACVCYWIVAPEIRAREFAGAVARSDLTTMSDITGFQDWPQAARSGDDEFLPLRMAPRTFTDWLRGRCVGEYSVPRVETVAQGILERLSSSDPDMWHGYQEYRIEFFALGGPRHEKLAGPESLFRMVVKGD